MGKRKSTTSSTQKSHSVVTPTNPEWVTSTAQGLTGGIQKLSAMDPYSFVAPASELETAAAQRAESLGGGSSSSGGNAWFDQLMSSAAPTVSAGSLLDNLEAYYNPYRDQVTSAAMADFDADAGRTRAAQDLALAASGAFGGSGPALTKSLTEGELSRARNTQLSKLLSDMFTTSAGLSNLDADRRQQAATANAQFALQDAQMKGQLGLEHERLGLERDANERSNIATQAAVGQQMREIDQARRTAPLDAQSALINMFSGLPLQLFAGQTSNTTSSGTSKTTETPSLLDTIGQVVSIGATAAGMFPGKAN